MSNKLKNETSPYLLQHSENPVDWYPWCKEAFEKAKAENKPVFLSIGYSTCHWCHVMAHESFEDMKTAEILNKYFISIKVDREERPDIDSIYMSVCQAFTGSGGWPMSIFMTWDKKPFFAGTYFPPQYHYGIPSFSDLLNGIASQWKNNHEELLRSADSVISHLKRSENTKLNADGQNLADDAVRHFKSVFDSENGGFGSAPKFPTPHNIMFLMLFSKINNDPDALYMAEKTLVQMRKGGIFDQIGFGFSRYSTDKYFLAPHFEKMLYDNALLIIAYSVAYSITKNELYLDTAKKTAEYVLREMTSADGGFYSAQDADSEGVEGKFYTFTFSEVINILGEEKGRMFAQTFNITSEGNFEGANIPNLLKSNDMSLNFSSEITKLYEYRKNRAKLHLDDKILISWNSMMIAAMSILYRISKKPEYLSAAEKAYEFIEKNLSQGSKLFTSWRSGKHSENSVSDDYIFYISALIELYNSTLDNKYLEKAENLCDKTLNLFLDIENGGFYLSSPENSELFMNPKETYDGAIPSGNSVMTYCLVRLYQLTEHNKYKKSAENQLAYMSSQAVNYPAGYCMFLMSKLLFENPPEHVAVALKDKSDLKRLKESLPIMANVSLITDRKEFPLINNKTTYYVCKNNACLPPTNEYRNLKN